MKKIPFLAIGLLFMFNGFAQPTTKTLPSAELKTMDGNSINTSKLENNGKPIVIIVWETFCRPCVNYFEGINDNLEDWKKETGVKIIIISVDDPRSSSKVAPMVRSKGWDFESYLDPNREFKTAMGVGACPYTFLINGAKKVVWEKQGYSTGGETDLFDLVKKVSKGEKIN